MDEYDKAIADLQAIIDDKPPQRYIALPLSDIRSMHDLPPNSELFIPPVLKGSWYWSGKLLRCVRVIGRGELSTAKARHWSSCDCPDCLSSNTCEIRAEAGYVIIYCNECGLQWQYYSAWCPACGGFLHGDEDQLQCDSCKQLWDTSLVKTANENNDLMVEL